MKNISNILFTFCALGFLFLACQEEDVPPKAPKPIDSLVSGQLPILELTSGLSVTEADSRRTFTLNFELNQVANNLSSVNIETEDVTAIQVEDYLAINSIQYSIDSGENSFEIKISIIGDKVVEEDESFNVKLSQAFGMQLKDTIYSITILDND